MAEEPKIKQIAKKTIALLQKSTTVADLDKASQSLRQAIVTLGAGKNTSRKETQHATAKARKAIRGQIGRRLRSKTSKMKFEIPMVSLDAFVSLCDRKDESELPTLKGAYYPMQLVPVKKLLPGEFDPSKPEKERLWFNKIDPDTGLCKTTYGNPKMLDINRDSELRYKPSTQTLSVTCWNAEVRDWEDGCMALTI